MIRVVQVPLARGLARLMLQLILLVRLIHALLGRSTHCLEAAQLARKVSGLVGCVGFRDFEESVGGVQTKMVEIEVSCHAAAECENGEDCDQPPQ